MAQSSDGQLAQQALQTEAGLVNTGGQVVAGILNALGRMVLNPSTIEEKAQEITGEVEPEVLPEEQDLTQSTIDVPYYNRQFFEIEMTKAGISFMPDDQTQANIGHQRYAIFSKDSAQVTEIARKYREPLNNENIAIRPGNYMISIMTRNPGEGQEISDIDAKGIALEEQHIGDKPTVKLNGLTQEEVSRIAVRFASRNIYTVTEYNDQTDSYSIKALEEHKDKLFEEMRNTKLFFGTEVGKYALDAAQYRQDTLGKVLSAYDEKSDKTMVLFDSENPEHYIKIDKNGYREYMLSTDENGKTTEMCFNKFELNETNRRDPSLMEHFDLLLNASISTMGTPAIKEEQYFANMSMEEKLLPGLQAKKGMIGENLMTEIERLKEVHQQEIQQLKEAERNEIAALADQGLSQEELQTKQTEIEARYRSEIQAVAIKAEADDPFHMYTISETRLVGAPAELQMSLTPEQGVSTESVSSLAKAMEITKLDFKDGTLITGITIEYSHENGRARELDQGDNLANIFMAGQVSEQKSPDREGLSLDDPDKSEREGLPFLEDYEEDQEEREQGFSEDE